MSAKIRTIAQMGMLFALAMALSFLEGLLPVLPGLPPGFKLGLSNIVTMYCLFFWGWRRALLMAVLKSGFVLLTRGVTAGLLSLTGGLASVAVMALLLLPKRSSLSYFTISLAGAVAHNLGQLAAAAFLLQTALSLYYMPVILVAGIVMGAVTGTVLKMVLPYLKRLNPETPHHKAES